MGRRRDEWVDIFQALGEAFFAVLRSEWDVLRHSWSGSARNIVFAVLHFVVAGALAVLLVLLLTTASVLFLHAQGFSAWAATLVVAGVVLGIILILGAVGYFVYLKRFKNPAATAGERLADHMEWWRERLLQGEYKEDSLSKEDHHGE